jgi:hypothetical protein
MSSKNFYPDTELYYPDYLDIIIQRLKLYIFNLIYPYMEATTENLSKRLILADFESGDEVAIRKSIETFFNTNATFPFTAYNIGDESLVENQYSHLQKTGTWYSKELNMYMAAFPYIINFPMVSFFNTPHDWRRVNTAVNYDDIVLNRIWCPCYINDILTQFPVDFDFETSKGSYSFRYDEALKTGNIFDFVHNVRVYYHKIVGVQPTNATSTGKQIPLVVRPVDDIILALKELNDKANLTNPSNYLINTIIAPKTPVVTTCNIANNATNVSVTQPIIFTFSVAMNETSLLSNIDIVPYASVTKTLDITGKILTITPDNFTASTQYEILINNKAISADTIPMADDYSLVFTTGV